MSTYQQILLALLAIDVGILLCIFKTKMDALFFYIVLFLICFYITGQDKLPEDKK